LTHTQSFYDKTKLWKWKEHNLCVIGHLLLHPKKILIAYCVTRHLDICNWVEAIFNWA